MLKKKRIEIHGVLEFPLTIGCVAFIKPENAEPIRTSPVKHFVKMPSGRIYIETRNSHYLLIPVAANAKCEVRS